MKRIKKFASLLLAIAMVLGMTMTTFAAGGNYDLTIATVKDHTYKIYQLITGDISSDGHTLSNMKKGSNAKVDVAEILNALTDKDKTHTHSEENGCYENGQLTCQKSTDIVFLQAEALGNAAANLIDRTKAATEVIGNGEEMTVTLAGGYYVIEDSYTDEGKGHTHGAECYENGKLICEKHVHTEDCYKDADGNTTTNPVCGYTSLSRVMVTLVQDVKMVPKDTTIAPDKKIVDDVDGDGSNEEVDTNEASIGDTITYKLSGLVPDMQDFYEEDENGDLTKGAFKFVFVDTMSKGLTPDKVLKCGDTHDHGEKCYEEVKSAFENNTVIYGKVGTKIATFKVTGLSTDSTTGATTIRIALMDAINYRHQKGDKVEVTITAILNQEAVVAPNTNPNDLAIDFSNDSNFDYEGDPFNPDFDDDEPHGTTPKVTVITYTTQLDITKVIGNTEDALTGAEFRLSSTNNAKVGYVTGTKYVEASEVAEDDELANTDDWYQLVDNAYTKTAPTEDTKNAYKDTETIYKEVIVAKPTETPTNNTMAQAFVNSEGKVVFTGLSVGVYTLEEVTVPDGYNKMADITFKVTWTKEGGFRVEDLQGMADGNTITVNGLTINDDVITGVGTTMTTVIPNFTGSLLPSTGGIGTTIFYIVGGILVIGAGILLVAKKRMSSK